ncbi:hypothetical protein OG401_23385 [Kitasatospora purpeofusca]|uniref:hypothetical protein n=1 Tax=Kitasatospora purpeofusca TaxID=67352 RepID=UPI002257814C|nr:hypothetical protein [Kitasatospora purpeofusca]MCX4687211.1 hypothetical protein [Kitasatospora purpeofusca]
MSNPNKQKGTAWESTVRNFLNRRLGLVDRAGKLLDPMNGENIRRAAQEGARDVGDIHAAPFILECKDVKSSAVPTWIRQGLTEADNAGFPLSAVVHKRRNSGAGTARVHFSVGTWTAIRNLLGMPVDDAAGLYGATYTARGIDTSRWYVTVSLADFADLLADVRGLHRATR